MKFLPAFVAAPLLLAHHSFQAEFDVNRPITLEGVVVKTEWMNPHAWIHLQVKDQIWMVETGSPNILIRRGFAKNSLEAGTEIIVQGYRSKSGDNKVNGGRVTFRDGRSLFLRETEPPGGRGGNPR